MWFFSTYSEFLCFLIILKLLVAWRTGTNANGSWRYEGKGVGGREEGRERGREGGREGERERGREGERERERERGRERGRERSINEKGRADRRRTLYVCPHLLPRHPPVSFAPH